MIQNQSYHFIKVADNTEVNIFKISHIIDSGDKLIINFNHSIETSKGQRVPDYIYVYDKDYIKSIKDFVKDYFIVGIRYNKDEEIFINPINVSCIKHFENKTIYNMNCDISNLNKQTNNNFNTVVEFITLKPTCDFIEK